MKQLVFLSLICAGLFSCNQEPASLQLNLKKGETYMQQYESSMVITQSMMGQEMSTEIGLTGAASFLAKDIKDDEYALEMMYQNLSMNMQTQGMNMTFSSDSVSEDDPVSKMLSFMMNKPIPAVMTKTGKVNSIEVDALFEGMTNEFPDLAPMQVEQITEQLKQTFGNEAFKGNIEMASAIFPDSTVVVGDEWTVNSELQSTIMADVSSTYKLVAEESDHFLIEGNSTITTQEENKYIEQPGGGRIEVKINGTMTSTIKVDKKTGWVIESTTEQKLDGESIFEGMGEGQEPMTMPMTIESTTTITDPSSK